MAKIQFINPGDRKMNMNKTTIKTTIASLVLAFSASVVASAESYQKRILFTPGDAHLAAEERGRVMIYDGMKDEEVELAMDQQFDRIENMMFIRTKHKQANGEYVADDDDC
jgi:hypothetical protein